MGSCDALGGLSPRECQCPAMKTKIDAVLLLIWKRSNVFCVSYKIHQNCTLSSFYLILRVQSVNGLILFFFAAHRICHSISRVLSCIEVKISNPDYTKKLITSPIIIKRLRLTVMLASSSYPVD